jgi:hypothetical protein
MYLSFNHSHLARVWGKSLPSVFIACEDIFTGFSPHRPERPSMHN